MARKFEVVIWSSATDYQRITDLEAPDVWRVITEHVVPDDGDAALFEQWAKLARYDSPSYAVPQKFSIEDGEDQYRMISVELTSGEEDIYAVDLTRTWKK